MRWVVRSIVAISTLLAAGAAAAACMPEGSEWCLRSGSRYHTFIMVRSRNGVAADLSGHETRNISATVECGRWVRGYSHLLWEPTYALDLDDRVQWQIWAAAPYAMLIAGFLTPVPIWIALESQVWRHRRRPQAAASYEHRTVGRRIGRAGAVAIGIAAVVGGLVWVSSFFGDINVSWRGSGGYRQFSCHRGTLAAMEFGRDAEELLHVERPPTVFESTQGLGAAIVVPPRPDAVAFRHDRLAVVPTGRLPPWFPPGSIDGWRASVPGWFVVLPATLVMVGVGVRRNRRAQQQMRRLRLNLCCRCGYDLRATPHICPECGDAGTGEGEKGERERGQVRFY